MRVVGVSVCPNVCFADDIETSKDMLADKPPNQEFDVPGLTLVDVDSMEDVVKHMTLGKQNRYGGILWLAPLPFLY